MRKIDYLKLAEIIKESRETASNNRATWPDGSGSAEYWRGAHSKAGDIAYRFAESASVDKAAFLKACGIE